MWLGSAVCVDIVATQSFPAVDRFLADPASRSAIALVRPETPQALRFVLRRNAAEENADVFEAWEWTQMGIAMVFFFLVLLGDRPPRSVLIILPVMMVILLLQRFVLTPHIAALGRDMAEVPVGALTNPAAPKFWAFHGFYYAFEIFKLLLGAGVAARLMIRRTPDSILKIKDGETKKDDSFPGGASLDSGPQTHSGQRVLKRRRIN